MAFITRHGLRDYAELMHRSTTDLEWFWRSVLEDLDIGFYEPYTRCPRHVARCRQTRWCVGGRMNIVHNCLEKWMGTPTEDTARAALGRRRRDHSNPDLRRAAGGGESLRERSAPARRPARRPRRAVHADVPRARSPRSSRSSRLGGIVLPLFSGYGADAVATRIDGCRSQGAGHRGRLLAARATCRDEGHRRRGRRRCHRRSQHVVVVPRLGIDVVDERPRSIAGRISSRVEPDTCVTEHTDADDPLMIIYTSGTTGRPKGAVHTHCGFPIKTAQDMVHCLRRARRRDDVLGQRHGLDDGPVGSVRHDAARRHDGALRRRARLPRPRSPVGDRRAPSRQRSGRLAHAHSLADAARRGAGRGATISRRCAFSARPASRGIPSRGAGSSTSSAAAACRSSTTPAAPKSPAVWSPATSSRRSSRRRSPVRRQASPPTSSTIRAGRCAIRSASWSSAQPWIGMTRGFWNDDERYLQTYWSRFPDVWVHGDWAAIDEDGLWYILGRSDDTIKIAGKRLGPAEVESVLVDDPAVLEAAAIGVPDEMKGQALVCFCVLRPGSRRRVAVARRSIEGAGGHSAGQAAATARRSPSCAICRRRATRRSCAA